MGDVPQVAGRMVRDVADRASQEKVVVVWTSIGRVVRVPAVVLRGLFVAGRQPRSFEYRLS